MAVCHLHLVSDATGETVNSVARACAVQFEGIEPVEHTWMLIRTKGQIEKALKGIAAEPGPVLFTLVNRELRIALVDGSNSVIEFISYEGTFIANNGPASGQSSINIGVSESSSTQVGQSLQVTGAIASTCNRNWTGVTTASKGSLNAGQN